VNVDGTCEAADELPAIVVVDDDLLTAVPSSNYVMGGTRRFHSRFARHVERIARIAALRESLLRTCP